MRMSSLSLGLAKTLLCLNFVWMRLAVAGNVDVRMIVILKPDAVSQRVPRMSETVSNLFPDQRVFVNPRIWEAVSLKTASLVRDLENKVSTKAFLAWGHLNHGFAANLNTQQVAALRADPRVEAVFEDLPGRLASSVPAGSWANNPATISYAPKFLPYPNPTYSLKGWNLKAINLYNSDPINDTPSYRTDGPYPVKAYVIDSGIQPHFDLNYNSQTDHISFDCHDNVGGNCTVANEGIPIGGVPSQIYTNQCDPHGTYVAGVIGAKRESPSIGIEGVAPGAQLVSVRVTNTCDTAAGRLAGMAYTSGVIAAINWIGNNAPNNGYNSLGQRRLSAVANMSIVWDGSLLPKERADINRVSAISALTNAIATAVAKGVFFTFAAGNSNQPACEIYPGAIGIGQPGAMSVGAIQSYNGTEGWGLDNRNVVAVESAELQIASSGPCVEIWAPGRDVQSTHAFISQSKLERPTGQPLALNPIVWGFGVPWGDMQPGQHYYAANSGSSLAAPHVAGAALLVANKAQRLGLPLPSPAEIEQTIAVKRAASIGYWDPLGRFANAADKEIRVLTVDGF